MAGSFSFTSNTIFLGFCPLHTIGSIAWLLYRRLMLLVSCISKQLCVCVQILHYCSNPVSILGMSECDSRVIDIHFCFKMSKLCKHCCATRGCSLWKCPTSPSVKLRRCLHDTRSSFIPVRLHPGSILSIYICLHDTNQNCIPERVIPERLHPGSRIGSKFSFQNEICLHVPPVSCKGGTGSFRYGNKLVDWLD